MVPLDHGRWFDQQHGPQAARPQPVAPLARSRTLGLALPRRPGRPRLHREIRQLIRQMSTANPLWGAPRIHGEILKLGIRVSQATVARYMVRRPQMPSPTWRSFLRNQMDGIAATDMFVVASASFRSVRDGRPPPRSQED
jgi:hypothetical protein